MPLTENGMACRILSKAKRGPVNSIWSAIGNPLADSRIDLSSLPQEIGRPLILAFRDSACWTVIGTSGVFGVIDSEAATTVGDRFLQAQPEGWREAPRGSYDMLIVQTTDGERRHWFPNEDFYTFWNIVNIFGI